MSLPEIKYDDDGCVWNFAYGANMNVKALTNRRKIKPIESIGGVLNGWKFSFDYRGLPFVEPAFSVVHKGEPTDRCHGVLHKMTEVDFIKLLRSEGSGGYDIEGYRPAEVFVDAYDGRKIRAYALTSTMGVLRKGHYPSKRYLTLLYEGAVHHKLEREWLDFLKSHPHHVPSTMGKIFFGCIAVVLLPFFVILFALNKAYPTKHVHYVFYHLGGCLWFVHDRLPSLFRGTMAKMLEKSA